MALVRPMPGSRAERAARRAARGSDLPFPKSPKPSAGAELSERKRVERKRVRPQHFGDGSSQDNPRSQDSQEADAAWRRACTGAARAAAAAARKRRRHEEQEQQDPARKRARRDEQEPQKQPRTRLSTQIRKRKRRREEEGGSSAGENGGMP